MFITNWSPTPWIWASGSSSPRTMFAVSSSVCRDGAASTANSCSGVASTVLVTWICSLTMVLPDRAGPDAAIQQRSRAGLVGHQSLALTVLLDAGSWLPDPPRRLPNRAGLHGAEATDLDVHRGGLRRWRQVEGPERDRGSGGQHVELDRRVVVAGIADGLAVAGHGGDADLMAALRSPVREGHTLRGSPVADEPVVGRQLDGQRGGVADGEVSEQESAHPAQLTSLRVQAGIGQHRLHGDRLEGRRRAWRRGTEPDLDPPVLGAAVGVVAPVGLLVGRDRLGLAEAHRGVA